MNKQERHYAIRQIIATAAVGRQDDLLRELRKRGYRSTQATLSRDLRELGVVRTIHGGRARYAFPSPSETQILRPIAGAETISIKANEMLIVVRTLPGCANTVGEFIDVQNQPDIIGTVAGDNTLLVIPRSRRKTHEIVNFLKHKLIEGH
jgi:transcriptional regulator of arginine metabolism